MKYFIRHLFILLLALAAMPSRACDMRQITTDDGLTNSAILSLLVDSQGFLWIGTCDGVNIYDGSNVYQARQLPEYAGISGNIIENVIESSPGTLWIQTNYGFNQVKTFEGILKVFPEFQGKEKIKAKPDGTVYVLAENSTLSYYSDTDDEFIKLVRLDCNFNDVKDFSVTDSYIRVFTSTGVVDYPLSHNQHNGIVVGTSVKVNNIPTLYAFNDGDFTIAINAEGDILEYRPGDSQPVKLHNILSDMKRRGEISALVRDANGNIFISFYTDGVIKVSKTMSSGYSTDDLGIKVGVFSLEKSDQQNVIWIGTDCHGVYTYTTEAYSIQSIRFNDFGNKITRPVRAIHLDEYNNLWLGTKGDGLLLVKDFNVSDGRHHGPETLYSTANSPLCNNSVFAFARSSRPILWIATDDGLNYYSYTDQSIHRIKTGDKQLIRISSLIEADDSTLLATTIGYGVFRARITGPADQPVLTDIRQYSIDNGNFSSNYFFSQALDNNGIPLLCNRGFGAFQLIGDSLQTIHYDTDRYDNKTILDVFSAIRDKDIIWLGTGNGLMKLTESNEQLFAGSENGFINNTIHAMLRDNDGNIWLSTNQGLIRFDCLTERSHVFARNYGLTVNEFSDGAAFKTPSVLFFGGVDGIAIIAKNPEFRVHGKYQPEMCVFQLRISGHDARLHDHITYKNGRAQLHLDNDQNYFSVTFTCPDYLNSGAYTYFYSLDGKIWINNGPSGHVSFTRLAHGTYTLMVQSINSNTGIESPVYCIDITIDAPWYLTTLAKIIYMLIAVALLALLARMYIQRQKNRQRQQLEKMEQAHREEVYEEKLRFFTNITHEFCTPLTLIFGSCERILASADANDHMLKYINLIRSNTERLNSLIQDLIDFRRIETGHKKRVIHSVGVSELSNDIYRQFNVIAEQNSIHFVNEIAPGITFNTDYKAILRIMSNLLSNAFKYTPTGGVVKFGLMVDEQGNLSISVYNTGKGIPETDKEKIFNRYSILDNVEENATRGLSSRNGLGMAICCSLVEMLDGSIDIDSEVGRYALFTVTLPPIAQTENDSLSDGRPVDTMTSHAIPAVTETDNTDSTPGNTVQVKGQDFILVIDDNKDILTLLSDSLSEYNIVTATNAVQALETLKNQKIDLIITDVMMPGIDGVTLTRQIKGNPHTMHIPLIILSAKNTSDEKVNGLASGADAYIGKPFNLSYLRAVIVRLLETQSRMKQYYNTSASAFEYNNGHLVDKESKVFIDSMIEFIDSNIDDTELSIEQVAKHMQMSVRNLYRRFKELELPSPNDFIKNHRITFAAKLLVTTSLTVQEIIYRSGFNNRSHFYREFDKQYGMTPKDYRNNNKTKTDL